MSFIFSFAVTCCLSAHLMLFLCFLAIFWLWRFWRLARNCFALFVLVYSARCSVDCFCCCYCCCAESATSVCSPLDTHTLHCAGRAAGVFLLYCCYWSFATFDMAQFAFLSLSSVSLSLPNFAWVSIALFNYWFIAILLAEVIQCQLRRRDLFPPRCGAPRHFVQRFNCFLTVVLMCPPTNLPTHALCPAECHALRSFVFLPQGLLSHE